MTSNPKDAYGLAKPGLSAVPPAALLAIGQAMAEGRAKYGPMNWRDTTVKSSVYYDAAMRHLFSWWDGEDWDQVTGVSHLAYAAANLCILIDGGLSTGMRDDRPTAGGTPEFITENTRKMEPVDVQ